MRRYGADVLLLLMKLLLLAIFAGQAGHFVYQSF